MKLVTAIVAAGVLLAWGGWIAKAKRDSGKERAAIAEQALVAREAELRARRQADADAEHAERLRELEAERVKLKRDHEENMKRIREIGRE